MKYRKSITFISLLTSLSLVSAGTAFAGTINGSGATFALPLVDACKVDFNKEKGHTVNYPGGGSGKGRTDFSAGNLVDFAGSDAAYSTGEPANIVYVPAYAAPIAIMYNLPTVKESIYLTPATLAQIFSGYITNWDDKAIAADNERVVKTPIYATTTKKVKDKNGKMVTKTVPLLDKKGKPKVTGYDEKTVNIDLPKQPITVWYRTDSSGTSENFTRFLKEANAGANERLWPKAASSTFSNATPNNISTFFNFQGGSGSAAIAAGTAGKVGAISYAELSFATDNKLGVANIQNAAGEFVAPSAAGTAAFLGAGNIQANGVVVLDFKKAVPGAYSLGTTSYGLGYPAASAKNADTQKIVAEWFTFLLEQCPTKYPEKGYAKITGPLYDKAKAQIALIK